MKGLRTLFGLIGLLVSLIMPWMYLIVYVAFLLALAGGNVGDLPWTVTPTMIIMPPVLFVASIVGIAKRKSKPGAIVAGVLFIIAAGIGIYFESVFSSPNPLITFLTYFFLAVGIFFFLTGLFQPKVLKTKAEKRAEQLKQQQIQNGTYVPPQAYYPQPQQAYQQPPAHNQYVPVNPAPVVPPPSPVTSPKSEPLSSVPIVSEPTPLTQNPEPVEAIPTDGWTCKLCETHNTPESKFCKNCGSPKDVQ